MNAGNMETRSSISKAASIEDVADFWDNHSVADHWDQTREADFEVRAKRRRRVTLDPDVYTRIEALAHEKGIQPETLVNLWLEERVLNPSAT